MSGMSSSVREHFVLPSSFSCTDLLPSHHHIFLHVSSFDWLKGCKNDQVACNLVCLFLVFNERDLCALQVMLVY